MQKVENQIKNLVINSIDNSAIISSSFFGGGGKSLESNYYLLIYYKKNKRVKCNLKALTYL